MNRRPRDRSEMRRLQAAGGRGLVMLDVRDDVAFLRGTATTGGLRAWVDECRAVGSDATVIVGEADYLPATHPWGRRRRVVSEGPPRVVEIVQPTPLGPLTAEEVEAPGQKPARTRMFLEQESDYAAAVALMREWRACRQDITAHLAAMRREVGEEALLTVFVSQPLEMYFFILHDHMVMHYLDWPETYQQAMDEVEATAHCLIDCAADAGADLIMFGGAGTEIFNPAMIEQHIVRPAIDYVEHCRARGLFSLMHCCGRTRIFLERGWFDRLRPTIFESFTEAPLGDIAAPVAAAHRLPEEVFFKGGISLDLLRRGTPGEVADAVRQACAAFGDRAFVLSGTCAVLTGTPRANLVAATTAAADYYGVD